MMQGGSLVDSSFALGHFCFLRCSFLTLAGTAFSAFRNSRSIVQAETETFHESLCRWETVLVTRARVRVSLDHLGLSREA